MTTNMQKFGAAICLFVALLTFQPASAQESHSKALARYITSDVVGVFYVDLDKLDLESTIQAAAKLGFQEQDELADLVEAMPMIKATIAQLKQAGISRAYALLRAADLQSLSTSWVMPLKPGSDPVAAKAAFASAATIFRQHFMAELEATDDAVFAASNQLQIDQLKNSRPIDTSGSQPMWDALGNGATGVVMFFDDDSRTVIRQLMPSLPAPFETITGKLIADDLAWGGAELTLDQTPSLKLEMQANSEEAAVTIEQGLTRSYRLLQQMPQTKQYLPESEFGFFLDALSPTRQANRVTVSTKKLTANMDRLGKVLAPQVKAARVEAAKSRRLNTLRQLALANHNFESAHGHFPTQASVDKSGKLLLSWRVQILPFLGRSEQQLYDQFHLDEPWDSEHNLKLVEQMPEIFEDPNPLSRQNNKAGKTIYLGMRAKA